LELNHKGHTQIDIELEAGFQVSKFEGWLRLCRTMSMAALFILDVVDPTVYFWSQQESENLDAATAITAASDSGGSVVTASTISNRNSSSSGSSYLRGRALVGVQSNAGTTPGSSGSVIDGDLGMVALVIRCSLLTPALLVSWLQAHDFFQIYTNTDCCLFAFCTFGSQPSGFRRAYLHQPLPPDEDQAYHDSDYAHCIRASSNYRAWRLAAQVHDNNQAWV
jgi:hypothetical protein